MESLPLGSTLNMCFFQLPINTVCLLWHIYVFLKMLSLVIALTYVAFTLKLVVNGPILRGGLKNRANKNSRRYFCGSISSLPILKNMAGLNGDTKNEMQSVKEQSTSYF